jgi:Ca2+-binding RTX toxin-like protein
VRVTLSATGKIVVALGGHVQGDTGDGFENITGSNFNDALTGNDSANVLKGDAGDFDQLSGGGGRDKLFGGAGTDELTGGAGADRLNGGAGTFDSIGYNNSAAGVRIVLGKNGAETIRKGSTQVGDDVVITKSASDTITLENVLKTNLSADDFDLILNT